VELVFIDDGANGRHFSDLVTDRFGVVALEVLTALPALLRLALDHLAKLFGWNQGANTTEVTGLPAPFLARGRSGRSPLDRGRIRGRGFGGVGRVLIDPFLQGGDTLLEGVDQRKHSRLSSRRNGVPDILRERWSIRHATVLPNSCRVHKIGS